MKQEARTEEAMSTKNRRSRGKAPRARQLMRMSSVGPNPEKSLTVCHNQPRSANMAISRIPEPQVQRIVQRHVAGQSVRAISRAEHRSRECVTRVVKGDQVQELVQRMRALVYGLANDAIDAVRHTLQKQKDGRVGYRLLMDIGAIPLPGEAEANALQARLPAPDELTPYERASAQDESGRINPWALALTRVGEEQAARFGFALPTPDELWRNRTVAALIDEMTGGENLHVSLSDSIEWNRLKALAEDVLQGKRAMTDREIVKVRNKYVDQR
jgi:hypothetical protein